MSATHDHRHHLQAASDGRSDPTATLTLRKEYTQRLRGVLARINAEIRRGVVERNVFGLRSGALQAARTPDPLHDLSFERRDGAVEQFRDWLETQERKGRVAVFTARENTYVRAAYERGLEQADTDLGAVGVTPPEASVAASLNLPVHREQLQALYTRNLTEWDGITSAMNQQISRELADGLAQGQNPTAIARSISDRVEKVGKKRATDLARTEIIRSHADATLNRYEQAGVTEVVGQAELSTAGDQRVCPICESLDGQTFSLDEARGLVPVHVRCRCRWQPAVTNTKQTQLPTT
jgi:SPP1 gp7 family putative phage head morphogenesis protein